MISEAIVTQVHVPELDVQGNLRAVEKLRIIEFGLRHLRAFNPDAYIILSGHGHRPNGLHYCDEVLWDDECLPLDEHGYVRGMPAQFKFVARGLEHARTLGATHCLKTRGDCIIGIPNIVNHCQQILQVEGRRLLITQQTGPERMGDCFMYGDLNLLCAIWAADNQVLNADGLQNTALHFRRAVHQEDAPWAEVVKSTCAFRDVHHLKFACLRWNYNNLQQLSDAAQTHLLNPATDFKPYHWGRINGWHQFAPDGTMTGSANWLWSERNFYA